jgi:hypothetical protein
MQTSVSSAAISAKDLGGNMPHWFGTARTNYFRVTNTERFKAWVDLMWTIEASQSINEPTKWKLQEMEGAGWPTSRDPDDHEIEGQELDFAAELSSHLQSGEVAILMCVGCNDLDYLTGEAVAVSSDGTKLTLSLQDIYDKAALEWPQREITRAEY